MNKNAQISNSSPCERCGRAAVGVINGVPFCDRHLGLDPNQTRPAAIEKVAQDLSNQ